MSPAQIVLAEPMMSNSSTRFRFLGVHPDGQRFLLQPEAQTRRGSQLTILRDWVGMLEERE